MKDNDEVIKRGMRYFDLRGTIYVVIYSRAGVVKLMPIKDNAIVEVWERKEFRIQIKLLKFIKIPHPPINRKNVSEHLLEFQFNILGKTMANTVTDSSWKTSWKLTRKEKDLFKSYAISTLKKVFRFNTGKARETYNFFDEQFGLQVSD